MSVPARTATSTSPADSPVQTHVLVEDDFAYEEVPAFWRDGEPRAWLTLRKLKVIWQEGTEGPPAYVLCGGPSGCGLYMIEIASTNGSWPAFACFRCDRVLIVTYGERGRPAQETEDAA